MKTPIFLTLALLAAATLPAIAQTNTHAADTNAVGTNTVATNVVTTNATGTNEAVVPVGQPPGLHAGARDTKPSIAPDIAATNDVAEITPTNAVRMNFQDVPLNTVLNYLSARMGLVINSEVDVHGMATIVSQQPVGTNEVVKLLTAALAKNGYAIRVDGRILNITSADNAITSSGTPVKEATSPNDIPINDEMATYILSVHTLNPVQLIKDLDSLIPPGARVSANEAGNAVIMTARQKEIHRFAEIINALDGSSISDVQVFLLTNADAKSVASELKEVYQSPDSAVARADRPRFRGFGNGFGFGGPGGDSGGQSSDSKNSTSKAVFTSDDQMNAVIASAPSDYFITISNIIRKLDQPSQSVTLVRAFHLKYADPQETSDEINNLFNDDSTKSDQNTRSAGFRFAPPWMQQPSSGSSKSEHMSKQTAVKVVPDARTESVIVTSSKDLMDEIAGVIEDLDKNPAGKQAVYTMDIDYADPVQVQATLAALFGGSSYKQPSSTQNQSVLQSREQANAQQQSQTTTTGLGSGSGTTGLR